MKYAMLALLVVGCSGTEVQEVTRVINGVCDASSQVQDALGGPCSLETCHANQWCGNVSGVPSCLGQDLQCEPCEAGTDGD